MKTSSPFRAGANLLLLTLILPLGLFAQGTNTIINPPAQVQMQNINFSNEINTDNNINDDNQATQVNVEDQQANPPAQAQHSALGNLFGSNSEDNDPQAKTTGCKDCDAVKNALRSARSSSGASHRGRSMGIKRWSKTFSGKLNMKMRKAFTRTHKVKTSYAICFNWH